MTEKGEGLLALGVWPEPISLQSTQNRRSATFRTRPLVVIERRLHVDCMLITSLMLFAFAIAVFLIAGAVAAICRLLTNSRGVSLMAGTLAIPALISASLIYWLSTMETDDAPPGIVIIGNVTAIAVITPLALFASHLATKFMDRRAARNAQLSQRTTISS